MHLSFKSAAACVVAVTTAAVGLAGLPASASTSASSSYFGSCPGFPTDATRSNPVVATPGPADQNWPVPIDVDTGSTAPVDGSVTGIHADATSLTLATYQHAAHLTGTADVFCSAHGEVTNTLTVGAGTSGLHLGDPVTVLATVGIDGTLSFNEVDGHSFYADADANGYFRVTDEATGTRAVNYTADAYLIVDGPSGASVTEEYKHDLYLSSNASAAVQETPAETYAPVTSWPWPTSVGAAPVDLGRDIGPRTVAFTTTIGATLDLDGSVQIDADAQLGDATGTADLRSMTASFAADAGNQGITLTLGTQPPVPVIPASSTTTTVSTDQPSYVRGSWVPATAHVTSASGDVPAGAVTFAIDGQPWETVPLDSTGTATSLLGYRGWTYADIAAGTHQVTADFVSTTGEAPSSGTTTFDVTKAPTTLALSTPPQGLMLGQAFTLTATVTHVADPYEAVMGQLDWKVDGRYEPPASISFGRGKFAVPGLHAGSHVVTACFDGNDSFEPSCVPPVSFTVDKAATTTTVTALEVPAKPGKPESLTATIGVVGPAGGTPTGTVTFRLDGAVLGPPVGFAGSGVTVPVDPKKLVGQHVVTATYSGDHDFVPSSGQLVFPKS